MRRIYDDLRNSNSGISDKTIERSKNLIALRTGENTFTVQSNSKPNNGYSVKKDGDDWNCSCKGFSFRNECAHVTKVKEVYDKEKEDY